MNKFNRVFKAFDFTIMFILLIIGLMIDSHARGGVIVFNGVWFVPFLYMMVKLLIREWIVCFREAKKK